MVSNKRYVQRVGDWIHIEALEEIRTIPIGQIGGIIFRPKVPDVTRPGFVQLVIGSVSGTALFRLPAGPSTATVHTQLMEELGADALTPSADEEATPGPSKQ